MLGATAAEWQASLELARLAAAHAMLILTPLLLGGLWLIMAAAIRTGAHKRTKMRTRRRALEADPVADAMRRARLAAMALQRDGSANTRH